MALHAYFHLTVRREARWIQDGSAHHGQVALGLKSEADMFFALAVAALAIDSFGKIAGIDRFGEWLFIASGNARVSVVAEHAIVGNGAAEPFVIRAVVTGVHGPIAAVFGVTRQRQFDKSIASSSRDVSPSVKAGAHDVVDGLLHNVDFVATGIKLVPQLRRHPLGFGVCLIGVGLVFAAIAIAHIALGWVLLVIGGAYCIWTWRRIEP